MTLAISLFRAICRFLTTLNIQYQVESKRAQTALTITEPILWGTTSLLFIGAEVSGYGGTSLAMTKAKIALAIILSLVAIITFLHYRPPLNWTNIGTHVSW